MTAPAQPVSDLFPTWHAASANQGAPLWGTACPWEDPRTLGLLLDLLDADLKSRRGRPTDELTAFAASVLGDAHRLEQAGPPPDVLEQLHLFRFYLSGQAVGHGITHGRGNLAFSWFVCSIADRAYVSIDPGMPQEVLYHVDRLERFVASRHPEVKGTAASAVLTWLGHLYYYSWKFGGLRELADLALPAAPRLIAFFVEHGDDRLKTEAVHAACQLATWTHQAERVVAGDIARSLAGLSGDTGLPAEARKRILMTLASPVGTHTDRPPSEWAERVLAEHGGQLVQHEHVQFLVNACATPEERDARYADVLAEVERFAAENAAQLRNDAAAICFRRAQLFDIIAPFVHDLLCRGHCQRAVDLIAAWFGVRPGRRRRSPVLGLVPTHRDGVLCAVEGRAAVLGRDTRAALRRVAEAINRALDMNIVVRDDHSAEPYERTGGWAREAHHAAELGEALAAFYEIDRVGAFLRDLADPPTGIVQPHAAHAPLQALMLRRLGMTLPIVTSFEEPEDDRPIRKVLIWTCGTILGEHEATAVETYFRARGVACEMHVGEDLTPEQFLRFYQDPTFDVLWVVAHGEFDPRVPHQAHIVLSADTDKRQIVTLADLCRHPVPSRGRRLLFLNICLGGSVLISEAPPRIGLAAMLAAANQAVVTHLWEAGSFVVPLFAMLHAIGLGRGEGFFRGFSFAARSLQTDRETALSLLREHAPACVELIQRVERSPFGVDLEDIRTWGTPVFYE